MSRVNPIYRSLLDKSVGSMLSAIEIYNKPNFEYREEIFSILAVNSWELLFKAFILRQNHFSLNSIYEKDYPKCKSGTKSKRAFVKKNRCGNPMSISILVAIDILLKQNIISPNLKANVESLVEFRDNAIHLVNVKPISKQIQELGFACIKNYMQVVKEWNLEIDLTKYNFYLMPLAYIDSQMFAEATFSRETKNFVQLLQRNLSLEDKSDEKFDIAVSIKLDFKRGNSFDSLPVKYDDENGIPISLSDEEWKKRYPLSYDDIRTQAKKRYLDFKQDRKYASLIKLIKKNKKLAYNRKLDPDNEKPLETWRYSSNIWQELDKHYTKK